jgi:hypothetical protein
MQHQKVTQFLEKEGWQTDKSNEQFIYYQPPERLGFQDSFYLPIPVLKKTGDFQVRLDHSMKVIADIYNTQPEKLFFDVENYVDVLKREALYFRLSSAEVMYRHTLEVDHIWQFLRNLSNAYSNYLRIKFRQRFSSLFQDNPVKINRATATLLEYSKLRLVDLEFRSFGFGVAMDATMGNEKIDFKEIRSWRKEILQEFKKEVIDIDFNSKKDVDRVIQNFSEKERKAIYDPLIKSINRDEYIVSVTNNNFEPRRTFSNIPSSTIRNIFPSAEKEPEEPSVEMMQIIIPVDKSKSKHILSIREIENNLFSQPIEEYSTTLNVVEFENEVIQLNKSISFTIRQDKEHGTFDIIFEPLDLHLPVKDFSKIEDTFFKAFHNTYKYYEHIKKTRRKVTSKEDKKLVAFFDKVVG